MNTPVKSALRGDVLPPGNEVRAIGRAHPFGGARIDCRVPAGFSITEILDLALRSRPGAVLGDFVVHLDGHVIAPENWPRVRLKAGTTLTFTPRLSGSGVWRSVLTVVVAVAAIVLAVPTGGLSLGLAATLGISASVASALIAGGIMLAGTLAINALLPVAAATPTPDSVATASLNSISGAQNQSNPFGPIPVVLGRHLQSPYFAAKPFTELVGNDQWLHLLFCLGYGPLAIDTLQIGQTDLSLYTDYEIEIHQGYSTDPVITLYPTRVDEVGLSVDLVANPGLNIETTAADTDGIAVDVTTPQGVYRLNTGNGKVEDYAVDIDVLYRPTGTVSWTQFGPMHFGTSQQVQRQTATVRVPRGQYDVALQKIGQANDPNVHEAATWTALRSFQYDQPFNSPKPLAMVAMRIKATGQLSGVISTFNCMCTSLVNAFDGTRWNQNAASQNPADLFRHVLQGPANARPRSDAQLDLANLEAWWAYCAANGFKFNQVINTVGSVYDKLFAIAAAGRAVPTFTNGLWGVDWDRPSDSIVQHFTPRNSWGFQLQHPYVQQPDGWRVSFINERNGYSQDERIVYDDGFDAGNATTFEGIQFPGVTDPDLIWRHGRFHIAQSRLRPEKVSLSVGWEHLVCTRGDRVRVTHDVMLIGLASGRVKSVAGQVVTFDEVLTIVLGTYGVMFRVPDDVRSFERAVDPSTVGGDYTELTLLGDLTLVTPGTLFSFGSTEQESAVYRVQGIAHQKDLVATLTLVDDAPAISTADQGAIPAYTPNVTLPPDPLTLPPQDFRYLEATDGTGNSVRAITRLSWTSSRRGKISASEVQAASGDGDWLPLAVLPYPQFSLDVPLPSPGIWSYRVRFQFDDNTVSAWVTLSKLTLLGLSAPPADVQNLRGTAYVGSTSSLAWDEVQDYRPIRYAVRLGEWDSGLELGTLAHPPYAAHGAGTYSVKAYAGPDAQRAYSVNAARIEIVGASLVTNVVATRDEAADGWNGIYSGTVGKSGSLIHTGGSADMLSQADYLNLPDVLNLGGQGNGIYELDPSRYIDNGRVAPCRVTITWIGSAQTVTDDFLGNPDVLNNPDILASGSTDLVQVYPELAVAQNSVLDDVFALDPTDNPANDLFAEADIFNDDTSFGPWLKYEPGTYVGRWFRSRLILNTSDPQTEAIAEGFVTTVDVDDRLDTWAIVGGVGTSLNQITVPSGGLTLTFASNGRTDPEPFNAGPGTDAVPLIQITNTNASAFDFQVTGLDLTGCTIVPRHSGTPTDAPNTNISIQGW